LWQFDAAASKSVPIGRSARIEVRAEAFNLLAKSFDSRGMALSLRGGTTDADLWQNTRPPIVSASSRVDSAHAAMSSHADPSAPVLCPYCRRPLRWSPTGWLARGVFECERCGEFPDFRSPVAADPVTASAAAAQNPPDVGRS
jgi:hypothetical protein